MDMVALEGRLAQSEKRSATLSDAMQEQIDLLNQQVKALLSLEKTANAEAPAVRRETDWEKQAGENSRFYIDTGLGDKTAYVIGLFGTGRRYINELILQNIGERAKYFRDGIRFHPGPTSMIYSGHATMRYVSRAPGVASGNEPHIGSGQIGICRFDFCLLVIPSIRC